MTPNNFLMTVPSTRRLNRRRAAVGTASLLGALVIGLGVSGCAAGGLPTSAPKPSSATSTPSSATPTPTRTPDTDVLPARSFKIEERPSYPAAEALVTEMFDKYTDSTSPGSASALVPQTQAGQDYARGFKFLLADLKSLFLWLPGTVSEDPTVLDAQIKSYTDKATDFERKFLAGEPMGVSISITRADGSVFSSDGTNTPFD